ncbi:MAG TPA: hypothetical protein PK095_10990 [Myxococcota bacterium]|nr:hypothetical protein [Myxococcota bacterium]
MFVRSIVAACVCAATGGPALGSPSWPVGEAEVVVAFDPSKIETPESVVFDLAGNMYVSLALTGEIRKIAPDGTQSTLAVLPLGVAPPGALLPGIMGALAVRFDGTLYASLASADPSQKGIWEVRPNGRARKLASLPEAALPNGIALRLGHLHVADSALGVVWRTSVHGGTAEAWIDDPVLDVVPGPIAIAPGANGIQFFGGEAYVCNSSAFTIYAFPVDLLGRAGAPRVHAVGVACDDFAFDLAGNVFVTTDPFNTLVLVRPDGSQEVLLTAEDGLDGPTAASFGPLGQKRTLFISNAAFPFFTTTFRPSIIALDLPIPGAPRWWF